MKPAFVRVLALLFMVILYFGNACSPTSSFKTLEDVSSVATCKSDESLMQDLLRETKQGYFDEKRKVAYQNLGDGWIQINGDMLYRAKGDLPSKPLPGGVSQGVGVQQSDRWPNGTIPYVIDPGLPNQQRVIDAVNHWNFLLNGTVTFVARSSQNDYVLFRKVSSGCSAPVGYFVNEGAHPVNLADECGSGNVAHEMGHIVGLDHEQNRLDRGSVVDIRFDRIDTAYASNFDITAGNRNYYGYDFGSIMHYSLYAFSKTGTDQTIIPKVAVPSGVTVGQRSSLSSGDIQSVKELYGTAGATPTPSPGVTPTPNPGGGNGPLGSGNCN